MVGCSRDRRLAKGLELDINPLFLLEILMTAFSICIAFYSGLSFRKSPWRASEMAYLVTKSEIMTAFGDKPETY